MKYFDFAATCPLDKDAADVYLKASTEYYGNTQSLHDIGSQAGNLLESCRTKLAAMLNVQKDGIFFTSGGSESNFLAINTLLSAKIKKGNHIITGSAEHSSVINTMKKLETEGYEITHLPLNGHGQVDLSLLRDSIRENTVLVSIQHVNPEIGSIQPIQEIGQICKANGILFHTDCVQSFGKIDLRQVVKHVSSLSISAHKFYGPKGIGALYIHPSLSWRPFLEGTSHEKGLRAGTLNVPAIAAMTVAADKAISNLKKNDEHFLFLRNSFLRSLEPIASKVEIHEAPAPSQLPGMIGLRISGLEGQWVMLECNRHGLAISTGTACQVGMQEPSKTMRAMGITDKSAKEFIRISFGSSTKLEDVEELGRVLVKITNQ